MKILPFQELRAICIIAVIMIHLPAGDVESGTLYYWLAFRKVINFPVAIFIFLSGYFTNFDALGHGVKEYYGKRLPRILVPYILWTSINVLYGLVLNRHYTGAKLLNVILLGGDNQLYFLVVLFQLVILSPLIHHALNSEFVKWRIFVFSITPLYLTIMYICNFYFNSTFNVYNKLFPAWLIFYALGIFVKKNGSQILEFKNLILMVSCLLTVQLLSIGEAFVLQDLLDLTTFSSSQISFGSFSYALTVIAVFYSLLNHSKVSSSLLVNIGERSFGIFFIHTYYIDIILRLTFFLEVTSISQLILQHIIVGSLALILSYLTILLIEYLIGVPKSRILGLR